MSKRQIIFASKVTVTIMQKCTRIIGRSTLISPALRRHFSVSAVEHSKNVGFIGLGNMGSHMAVNLIKGGHNVTVFDIVKSSVDSVVAEGAQAASCPAEVASNSDRIITMLPSSPHVKNCFTADDGILSTVQPGTLILDSSTIDPMMSKSVSELAQAKGAVYMDAPVSGGIMAAKGATLTFMVGGPEDKFPEAKEILSLMGKNVVHCGDVSTGQAAKICNNMLLGITMIGVSEAMNLGKRLGLDPKQLAHILNTSSGRCWSSDTYNPCPGVLENVPSSNNYQGGFQTALMTKDLGLAQDAATATQSPNPLGSAAHQMYRVLCNHGYDKLDFSSVYKFLQEQEKKN